MSLAYGQQSSPIRACPSGQPRQQTRRQRHANPDKTPLRGVTLDPVDQTDEMSSDAPSPTSNAEPGSLEAVARAYMASFATGDPDSVAAHVAPGFVNEHTAALGSGCIGRDAYRERLPGFLNDMDGLVYDVEHVVVDGGMAAVFYTMRARWQGETPIEVRGAQRLEIDGGLITHRVDYWDSKVFLDQLEAASGAA